jgi:hypothetical protein
VPTIATVFTECLFITITYPLHVSVPTGHLQVEYIYRLIAKELFLLYKGNAVAQWLSHYYAANRKVAGLIPDEIIFVNLLKPSGRSRPWGLLSL